MSWLAAGLGLAGTLAESAISYYNQQSVNDTNSAIARANNQTAINLAASNQQFQEKMSNSAYQRSVKDLRKAGLNPLLAVGGMSAASTPSGSVPNLTTPTAHASADFSGVGKGSREIANYVSDLYKAQVNSAKADNEVKKATVKNIDAQTDKTKKESESIDPDVIRENREHPGKLGAETIHFKRSVVDPIMDLFSSAKAWLKDGMTPSGKPSELLDSVNRLRTSPKVHTSPRFNHENKTRSSAPVRSSRRHN